MGEILYTIKNPEGEYKQLTPGEYELLEALKRYKKVKIEGLEAKFRNEKVPRHLKNMPRERIYQLYMKLADKGFCYVRSKHGRLLKNTVRSL